MVSPLERGSERDKYHCPGELEIMQHQLAGPRAVAQRLGQALAGPDLDAAVACFAADNHDEAPARRGEVVQDKQKVRENFAALSRDVPDLRADLVRRRQTGPASAIRGNVPAVAGLAAAR